MKQSEAVIRNEYGIHCRPSAVIIKECLDYEGQILVRTDDGCEADVKNMLALLGLGLQYGQRVTILVDGPGDDEVCEQVASLFETNFDFKR